jgi:hypothetical protein
MRHNIKLLKKNLSFLLAIIFISLNVSGDVIPNPIRIKGIVPRHPVNIQMVSEIVLVDLFKDSSIVECKFNMKNLGKASEVEIGFPMMNFYLWPPKGYMWMPSKDDDIYKDKFKVWVNGETINKVSIYIPDELKDLFLKESKNHNENYNPEWYKQIRMYEQENKPWYLWKTRFSKNESMQIIVKYSLPSGATRLNRFFNYILNTGSSWKGKIEHADVIVSVKDFGMDQLIKMSPSNYLKKDNQLIWNFKDLEPTSDDDIFIDYEEIKGSYKERIARNKANMLPYYIDNIKTDSIDSLRLDNVAKVSVLRGNDIDKSGSVYVYTNAFVFKSFLEKIKKGFSKINDQLSKESAENIRKNYLLIVNGKELKQGFVFAKLFDLDSSKILSITIRRTTHKKKVILIKESA